VFPGLLAVGGLQPPPPALPSDHARQLRKRIINKALWQGLGLGAELSPSAIAFLGRRLPFGPYGPYHAETQGRNPAQC
jgi:hypothetical protein